MDLSRRELLKLLGVSTVFGYKFLSPVSAYANSTGYKLSFGPSLETPIQEIYPAVFRDEIYVAGGFVPKREAIFFGLVPSNQVFAYSLKHKTWRTGANLPEARHHLGMVSNSQYLYGIGGFSGDKSNAWKIKDTVYRVTSKEAEWSHGPSLPISMAESVYASCDENIHVIGGKTPKKGHPPNKRISTPPLLHSSRICAKYC